MGEGEGSEGRGIEQAQGEKEMPSERSSNKKESARDRMHGHGKVFLLCHFREGGRIEGKSGPEYSLAWLTPK